MILGRFQLLRVSEDTCTVKHVNTSSVWHKELWAAWKHKLTVRPRLSGPTLSLETPELLQHRCLLAAEWWRKSSREEDVISACRRRAGNHSSRREQRQGEEEESLCNWRSDVMVVFTLCLSAGLRRSYLPYIRTALPQHTHTHTHC